MIDLIVQDEKLKKLVNGTREMTNFSMWQNLGWGEEGVKSGYWEIRDKEEKEPSERNQSEDKNSSGRKWSVSQQNEWKAHIRKMMWMFFGTK